MHVHCQLQASFLGLPTQTLTQVLFSNAKNKQILVTNYNVKQNEFTYAVLSENEILFSKKVSKQFG